MKQMKIIMGTMTFGPQVDRVASREMLNLFFKSGYNEIDTAYVYNGGETENILGSELSQASNATPIIATKVNPQVTGKLDAPSVVMQLNESLKRMGRDQVDVLYLHMPDPHTPIEETLGACAKLFEEGKFNELGLSNFPAWMVVDIWHLCEKRGWPKPTVYQGLYNCLSRNIEPELIPALRRLGIRFYAFNPLAGGMLSGKHRNYSNDPAPGRFSLRESYRNRYWKESIFKALEIMVERCREFDIAPAEAALRWLAYHSKLESSLGDGIIIGASKIGHLEQNLAAVQQGELPLEILDAMTDAHSESRLDSPNYFYFFKAKSD